ncbi:MAG: zinc dependent phospholipase C family protein [Eubacteriales bacterium]|nr:zinc dependent phospholipase C family protein [Eubacteriales bacterium]
MPAAYAHHIFGEACIQTMPPKFRKACLAHREEFNFGVHGPDIFFYYDPLKKNKVNTFGSSMHFRSGKAFFRDTREPFQRLDDKGAMMAYLLGFLAHFALDSSCHGYINRLTEESGLSHNYIESQYEAYLMRKDGLDPLLVDRSETLFPGKKTAAILARFFPLSAKEVKKATDGQKHVLHLLFSPNEKKKVALRKIIDRLQISGDFGDLFLDYEEDIRCAESNDRIYKMQKQALELYPVLMKNYVNFLYAHEELNEAFDLNFEGERIDE